MCGKDGIRGVLVVSPVLSLLDPRALCDGGAILETMDWRERLALESYRLSCKDRLK